MNCPYKRLTSRLHLAHQLTKVIAMEAITKRVSDESGCALI